MVRGLIKDVAVYGITGALTKSLHFFLVPLYTRYFLPAQFGVVDLITVVMGLLSLIGLLQLESAMGRLYSETKDFTSKKKIASTGLVGVFFCSFIILILVNVFANQLSLYFFDDSSKSHLFRISSAMIPLTGFYGYLINIIRFNRNPVLYGVIVLIQVIVTLMSVIWFVVVLQMNIEGLFYGQIIGLLIPVVLLLIFLLKQNFIGLHWNRTIFESLLKFGLPLLPAVLTGGSVVYISRFFMIHYLTLEDVGVYAIAVKIASLMLLVDDAIRMTWTPFLYENLSNPSHKRIFKRIFQIGSIGIFLVIVVVWILLPLLFNFFITETYQDVRLITMILVMDFGIRSIVQIMLIGPAVTKKTIYNLIVTLTGLLVYVLVLALLTPRLGLIGIALGTLVSSLFVLSLSWLVTERLYYIGYSILGFIAPLVVILSILFYQIMTANGFAKSDQASINWEKKYTLRLPVEVQSRLLSLNP